MILETVVIDIKPGQSENFEEAIKKALPLISETKGFKSIELRPSVETDDRYLLLVQWETIDDHLIGFGQSDRYAKWRSMLHDFYVPFPRPEHYGEPLKLG